MHLCSRETPTAYTHLLTLVILIDDEYVKFSSNSLIIAQSIHNLLSDVPDNSNETNIRQSEYNCFRMRYADIAYYIMR